MFSVRVANAGDAPKMARIRVDSWLVVYRGKESDALLDEQGVERREVFWRERFKQASGRVFVVETDDEIVGFCDLIPSRDKGADPKKIVEIAAIYVLPESRRQGAGKSLGYHVVEKARKQCYEAVTVWVSASNSDAMRFYESLGFARDGVFKIEKVSDGSDLQQLRYRITL